VNRLLEVGEVRAASATWRLRLGAAVLAALFVMLLAGAAPRAAWATCAAPANEIERENCLPGTLPSEWDVSGAGDANIQGYATDISVNQSQTVQFKVDTNSSNYRLDIYRMGYYGGRGARLVATVQPSASLPQNQPACTTEGNTGLVECSSWAVSAAWTVPATAVSGVYFAALVREDGTPGASHVPFVVRDDDGASDVLFQTSDTTWQAYNAYGGKSLYTGGPGSNPSRAYKVSYDRPFTTRDNAEEDFVFNAEYPMVRWLERNGYDVSYTTGVDSDRRGPLIKQHRAFLSVGHDEYWSGAQRANVVAARDVGVDLAFFSGNEVFWKTRWEDNYRTLVSYKETHANAKIDPAATTWTGTWRDPRGFNPQGGQPENALTGTAFTVNSGTTAIRVPAADGRMRLWRSTSVATQAAGGVAVLSDGTLGYEWDEDLDNGFRPAGLVRMSTTTVDGVEKLQDHGSTYDSDTATHHLTLYRDTNGAAADALVFGAGTVQWSWGLDGEHDRGSSQTSPAIQQATVNLLADMGPRPATLQAGLAPAAASTDVTPPTARITSPGPGGVAAGRITIQGTAADAGGRVGGVEVSTNGGATWHPAAGRESWSYEWTPSATGDATLLARASDDSANVGAPSAAVRVEVGGRTCPCSLFGAFSGVATDDGASIEVGTRFHPDRDGFVTALRYYAAAAGAGPVGRLYTASGTKLGCGVAARRAAQPGAGGRRGDVRRLVLLGRAIRQRRRLLLRRARRAAAARACQCGRIPVRRRLPDRVLRREQLLGRRGVRARRGGSAARWRQRRRRLLGQRQAGRRRPPGRPPVPAARAPRARQAAEGARLARGPREAQGHVPRRRDRLQGAAAAAPQGPQPGQPALRRRRRRPAHRAPLPEPLRAAEAHARSRAAGDRGRVRA
jgi:hypothetical protein